MTAQRWFGLLVLVLAFLPAAAELADDTDDPKPQPPPRPRTTKEVRELLAMHVTRFPGIKDRRTTFKEALDLFTARYSLQFEVDQVAFRDEVPPIPNILGYPVHGPVPPVSDRSLYSTLRMVLNRTPATSGTTFMIRGNVIVITTGQRLAGMRLRDEPPPDLRTAPRARELRAALVKQVNFAGFEKDERLALADILHRLAEQYGLTFEVNQTAFGSEVPPLPEVLGTPLAEKQGLPSMDNTTPAVVLQMALDRVPPTGVATFLLRHDCIEITTRQFVQAEKAGVMLPASFTARLVP